MSKAKQQRADLLRQQVIDLNGPGTVLADFQSLLEFIGPEGLRSTSKYHLLPLERLRELDERMRKPLRPRLERPQQRSFPHLNGLYLLLRATQLGVPKGEGKKSGMLVLNPPMHDQWQTLNPTERYFNLLEAWLRLGRAEMLGERGGGWYSMMLGRAMEKWQVIGDRELDLCRDPNRYRYFIHNPLSACTLALFDLFGLVNLQRGEPGEGENWRLQTVARTAFGEALLETILARGVGELLSDEEDRPDFGAWQPHLQEFFPEWRNNLKFPEPEFRDGVYYFKVKLGSPWRRIAIAADCDLEELAGWIITAFEFDGDHLYEFSFPDRDGLTVSVAHPYVDDADMHTDGYSIGYLPLAEGQSMKFTYDYGANWCFDVKLEKVEPPNPRMTKPRIVESHGKAPDEYED